MTSKLSQIKTDWRARFWWFTPVIPATQEAGSTRIMVQSQPRQIVHEILSQKTKQTNKNHKKVWQRGSSGRAPVR
jgi:hypothetical protein